MINAYKTYSYQVVESSVRYNAGPSRLGMFFPVVVIISDIDVERPAVVEIKL